MTKTIQEAVLDLKSTRDMQEQQLLSDGARMSLDMNHEQRAKARALADVLGEQDVDFVERNFDYLDAASRAKKLYQDLPQESVRWYTSIY